MPVKGKPKGKVTPKPQTGPKKPAPKPAPKQPRLPGAADAKIEELQGLAERYVFARDARMAMTPPEVEAKNALIAGMHKHKLTDYEYTDEKGTYKIELTTEKEKLTVKVPKKSKVADTDDDDF